MVLYDVDSAVAAFFSFLEYYCHSFFIHFRRRKIQTVDLLLRQRFYCFPYKTSTIRKESSLTVLHGHKTT